jgi:predicted transcriptional regulator
VADRPVVAVALISIHPRFANAILDGTKKVEFRKVCFRRSITHVLLYATAPIQQIVGYVEVSEIEECAPATLWRRYRQVAGIDRAAFFAYYQGKAIGVAVKVRRPRRLSRPLALEELHRGATPPQSFLYSTPDALRRVQARAAGTYAQRYGSEAPGSLRSASGGPVRCP